MWASYRKKNEKITRREVWEKDLKREYQDLKINIQKKTT